MALSDEAVNEFKGIYKKEFGKDLSDREARESSERLVGLFKILFDSHLEELRRKRRLKKEPEGFSLSDTYSCQVCRNNVGPTANWYSQWGITCLLCHKALKDGIVPGFVCQNHNSRYAMWELKSMFGIHPQTARKLVRLGKLKARIVLAPNGQPYEYVFLKKENPLLIDPNRDTPGIKSWKRNRDKNLDARIRVEKKKDREEMEQRKAELRKKLKRRV